MLDKTFYCNYCLIRYISPEAFFHEATILAEIVFCFIMGISESYFNYSDLTRVELLWQEKR